MPQVSPTPESRVCPGCDVERPAGEYYADSSRYDGLSYLCRACHRKAGRDRAKRWYAAHSAEHIAAVIARRKRERAARDEQ